MRRYSRAFVLFAIAVIVLGVTSPAAVVAQGTGGNDEPSVSMQAADLSEGLPKPTCPILALDLDTSYDNEALDILGIAYTLVTPSAFSTINLDNFHVLYVGWEYSGGDDPAAFTALNARKSDIANWVQKGNSIVVLGEDPDWGYAWIPLAVTQTEEDANTVTITAPSHAIMTGLTDGLLSGWGNSYHEYFNTWDPAFTVLAENAAHDPITLVATHGAGYIIITGQDPDYHTVVGSRPGAMLLLNNMLSYACTAVEHAVGGYAVPVNKLGLLAPWIALASVVSLAGAIAVALKKGKR